MQFSVFGIIYILLSLFFCKKKKWFTYWFVFSNSLFYTSVVVIGDFPVKPYHIATLIMFFVFVKGDLIRKFSFREKDSSVLILFLIWIYLTFIFSFLLRNIDVIPPSQDMSDYQDLQKLHVTLGSISQTIFPLFGIFSFFVIKAYITTKQDIKDFTKGYALSFIPLAVTVIILFVFRNITHSSALLQGFFSFINPTYTRNVAGNKWGAIGDISRTFTYIGEASYTAKYYLILISVFGGFLLYKKNSWKQKSFYLFLLLLLFALISILGSTTGYVGLVILLILFGFIHFRYKNVMPKPYLNSNKNFLVINIFFSILLLAPLLIIFNDQLSFFINYLFVNHVDKIEGDTGSGIVRYNTNLIALDIFIKSPIFGVGYGHNRTNSYFTFLLSNVGIVGFCLLNFFCFYLILMPLKKLNNMPTDLKIHCIIYVIMFMISYFINFSFSSSVAIAFGWIWANAAILGALIRWRSLEDIEN